MEKRHNMTHFFDKSDKRDSQSEQFKNFLLWLKKQEDERLNAKTLTQRIHDLEQKKTEQERLEAFICLRHLSSIDREWCSACRQHHTKVWEECQRVRKTFS